MAKLYVLENAGFPVVETNHIASVRTGQIKAQYGMNTALRTTGLNQGLLLMVDDVKKEVGLPTGPNDYANYLHASEEQIYESVLGRNSFQLKYPKLPKMLKLAEGDSFETNAVAFAAVNVTAAKAAGYTVGVPTTDGDITLLAAATGGETVVLEVIEWVTLPNGFTGVKFVVQKA